LQREYAGLNFLVDVVAPERDRISVVMAGEVGMAILWRDPILRTVGAQTSTEEISVWDGAGVEMPKEHFVPLATLLRVVEQLVSEGTLSTELEWAVEE
jgi:hypothetical protein